MHVRRVFADGLAEQGIDQPDDRRIALLLQQVGGLRHLVGQAEQVQFLVQALGDLFGGALALAIDAGQARGERRRLQHQDRQISTAQTLHFGHGGQGCIAAHDQAQGRPLAFQQHPQAPGETKGQRLAHRSPERCGRGSADGACGEDSNNWRASRGSSSELFFREPGLLRSRSAS
ncbi:hypothetical protein D3C78_1469470 [compost metagenome]